MEQSVLNNTILNPNEGLLSVMNAQRTSPAVVTDTVSNITYNAIGGATGDYSHSSGEITINTIGIYDVDLIIGELFGTSNRDVEVTFEKNGTPILYCKSVVTVNNNSQSTFLKERVVISSVGTVIRFRIRYLETGSGVDINYDSVLLLVKKL